MRLRSPHRRIRAGLTHANPLVVAATWALLLVLIGVLVRLVVVLVDDLWVFAIAWMQP